MSSDPRQTEYIIEPSRWRVKDIPARLRPREAMTRLGIENVNDDVLVAVLLGSGAPGLNVIDLSRALLKHFGSLSALTAASETELAGFKGVGPVKAQKLKAALDVGRRLQEEALGERVTIRTPEDVERLLKAKVRGLETEVFWSIHLNAKNVVVGAPRVITRGLLDASLVHPREVFREAVRAATAAVVVAHNHPSGDPSPSAEDVRVTKQLVEAGRVVDIKVLDHVILGCGDSAGARPFLSMREEGIVNF